MSWEYLRTLKTTIYSAGRINILDCPQSFDQIDHGHRRTPFSPADTDVNEIRLFLKINHCRQPKRLASSEGQQSQTWSFYYLVSRTSRDND